jgi:hypothetical protein
LVGTRGAAKVREDFFAVANLKRESKKRESREGKVRQKLWTRCDSNTGLSQVLPTDNDATSPATPVLNLRYLVVWRPTLIASGCLVVRVPYH